jgi:hypothetical protein
MNFIGIESSRIVLLTQVHRPSGPLYLPDANAKMAERYSFVKSPAPEQASDAVLTFSVGKFQDVQINELSIYSDGLIVSSPSSTDILDAFIDDLLSWAESELGLVQAPTAQPKKYYESSIVVHSMSDLPAALRPRNDLTAVLELALESAGIECPYKFTGFLFDADPASFPGTRKPFRFIVDRRVGVPFSQHLFFSQAPLRTKDHLNLLESLEGLALKAAPSASRH